MTSRNKTYYEILGVSEDASFEEIRAAFRERAREYHPDRNPDPDAVERMQEVNEAYEVLRDSEQRAAYDRMHRTFAASPAELARAREIAADILGGIAFNLGYAIGAGVRNHWTLRIHRIEDLPTGVWHAAYEAALESALTGMGQPEIRQTALDSAWSSVLSDSTRMAFRHALSERSSTFTEMFAVDIGVTILGSIASFTGAALGSQNIRENLPGSAWNQADEAIKRSVNRSIQLRGGIVTPQMLRDSAFVSFVMDSATQEAMTVLEPYRADIGRRIGRAALYRDDSGRRYRQAANGGTGRFVATPEGRDSIKVGCFLIVGVMILALLVPWILSMSSRPPLPDSTSVPTLVPQATSASLGTGEIIPQVGDCIDGYNIVPCSAPGAAQINHVHWYPSNAPWPGTQWYDDAIRYCPAGTTQYTHPERGRWQQGTKVLFCVA